MGGFDIGRLRLAAQGVEGGRCERPEDVVRRLGAMQAQDLRQALWAVGVRSAGATEAEVEAALAGGRIVRTWPMRGTIHLVPPESAKWMVQLLAPRVLATSKKRRESLGLSPDVLAKCFDLLAGALAGGKSLSRPGAMQLLESHGISTAGQRGYHILWWSALNGLICFGPPEGNQQTFVLLDEWAPAAKELTREEALARLAQVYFAGHGPATVHDFAWWAGLTVADARKGLAFVQDRLCCERIGETEYWMGEGTLAGPGDEGPGVHLLPGFDEFLLGYKDRDAVLDPLHAGKVVPGGNGIFMPLVVERGRIAGVWKRSVAKGAVDVEVQPFDRLEAQQEHLFAAASRYARFLGTERVTLR